MKNKTQVFIQPRATIFSNVDRVQIYNLFGDKYKRETIQKEGF